MAMVLVASMAAAAPVLAEQPATGAIDAAKLWTKQCASCHGADGKGKTKAGEKLDVRDLTAADVKATMDRAKVIEAIKSGVKAKDSDKFVMKPLGDKLSAAEIEALADFSLALK